MKFSSAGNLSKKSYGNELVKGSSPGCGEPFAEYIASRIFSKFSGLETIIYYLQPADKYPEVKSYCGYVSISERYKNTLLRFADTFDKHYNLRTNEDALRCYIDVGLSIDHFCRMSIMDALIGNQDRHWNNLDIIVKSDGSIKNAPVLDFGASLCYNLRASEINFKDKNGIGINYCSNMFHNHSDQVSFIMDKFEPKNLFSFTEQDLIDCLEKDCINAYLSMNKERRDKIKEYLIRRYRFFITPFLK